MPISEELFRRSDVEHLVESAKLAVRGGRPHQQTDRSRSASDVGREREGCERVGALDAAASCI